MKKMIFSAAAFALVAVSSMALAPTTAEAIPAFARQTGAACLSCHFQTFPAINSFGRAFKMGSFTDVGDQALVEDDAMSIPSVLNMTAVIRGNYTNTSVTGAVGDGVYTLPADAVLMIAGRIGTNSGAFIEFTGNGGTTGSSGAANWQFLNSFDVGDFKVGVSGANTGFGGSAAMEVSNVFGQHGAKLAGRNVSAIQAAGFANQTTAIAAWFGNDMGYLQIALLAPDAATGGTAQVGSSFAKLIRGLATVDVGGWDTTLGFGIVTGSAGKGTVGGTATAVRVPMNLQFIDLEAKGEVGDMSIAFLADWAHAKGKTATSTAAANFYGAATAPSTVSAAGIVTAGVASTNATGKKWDGYSVRVEVKPLEHFMFGIGYGYNKQTQALATAADIVAKTTHLAATYEIYQNFELNLVYDSVKANGGTKLLPTSNTTRTTVLEFEALM